MLHGESGCSSWYGPIVTSRQAVVRGILVGVVISKLEAHRAGPLRGYIAMLAVCKEHRGKGIGMKSMASSRIL